MARALSRRRFVNNVARAALSERGVGEVHILAAYRFLAKPRTHDDRTYAPHYFYKMLGACVADGWLVMDGDAIVIPHWASDPRNPTADDYENDAACRRGQVAARVRRHRAARSRNSVANGPQKNVDLLRVCDPVTPHTDPESASEQQKQRDELRGGARLSPPAPSAPSALRPGGRTARAVMVAEPPTAEPAPIGAPADDGSKPPAQAHPVAHGCADDDPEPPGSGPAWFAWLQRRHSPKPEPVAEEAVDAPQEPVPPPPTQEPPSSPVREAQAHQRPPRVVLGIIDRPGMDVVRAVNIPDRWGVDMRVIARYAHNQGMLARAVESTLSKVRQGKVRNPPAYLYGHLRNQALGTPPTKHCQGRHS